MTHLMVMRNEVLSKGIMVDVETAGPGPSHYALLSLGACVIKDPTRRFYIEMVPDRRSSVPAAMAVQKRTLTSFYQNGVLPALALARFHTWVETVYDQPIFVAHNAPFDWMFYADYCVRYRQPNPFGYRAIDTASLCGRIMTTPLLHHAGEDALLQTLDLRRYYGL